MKKNHHILGATKFEVHLQNFSGVSKRAGCGGTIYLGITRKHLRYLRLDTITAGSVFLITNLVETKREILSPF